MEPGPQVGHLSTECNMTVGCRNHAWQGLQKESTI